MSMLFTELKKQRNFKVYDVIKAINTFVQEEMGSLYDIRLAEDIWLQVTEVYKLTILTVGGKVRRHPIQVLRSLQE